MTIYRFSGDSPIHEIIIRKSAGGGVRAFLFAGDHAKPEHILPAKELLNAEGGHCVASIFENRHCLEVRGIRNIDKLESALRSRGLIKGTTTITKSQNNEYSLKEKITHNMLWLCGVLNVIADMGFVGYGHLKQELKPEEKHWEEQAAGVAYAAGSIALTAFGSGDKTDHHVRDICTKLHAKLHADGLIIHGTSAASSFTNETHQGPFQRLYKFLHKHPSEVGNSFTALAGALVAKSALKADDNTSKFLESSLGASTFAAGLTAAYIKERAPLPGEKPPTSIPGKIWRWIEKGPNKIAGYGYMYSSIVHGAETIRKLLSAKTDYQETPDKIPKAYLAYTLRGFFVVMNLVAEIVLALSSKGHGEGVKSDISVEDTAYSIVADTIGHQPASMRERLISDLSRDFLARPDVLGGKPDGIESKLRERVKLLNGNLWAGTQTQNPSAPIATAITVEKSQRPTLDWQTRSQLTPQLAGVNI